MKTFKKHSHKNTITLVLLALTLAAVAMLGTKTPASSRVSNGILPSLEYTCIKGEAIYPWCQAFETADHLIPSTVAPGVTTAFASKGGSDKTHPAGAIWIARDGDQLRYQVWEGSPKATAAQADAFFAKNAAQAHSLTADFGFLGEYLDEYKTAKGQVVRVVIRINHRQWVARVESAPSANDLLSEKFYVRAQPSR